MYKAGKLKTNKVAKKNKKYLLSKLLITKRRWI